MVAHISKFLFLTSFISINKALSCIWALFQNVFYSVLSKGYLIFITRKVSEQSKILMFSKNFYAWKHVYIIYRCNTCCLVVIPHCGESPRALHCLSENQLELKLFVLHGINPLHCFLGCWLHCLSAFLHLLFTRKTGILGKCGSTNVRNGVNSTEITKFVGCLSF